MVESLWGCRVTLGQLQEGKWIESAALLTATGEKGRR